jgi:hypothetical protein
MYACLVGLFSRDLRRLLAPWGALSWPSPRDILCSMPHADQDVVSRPRAIALVVLAGVYTALTSLLCTGFQGLLPVLIAEKVLYRFSEFTVPRLAGEVGIFL